MPIAFIAQAGRCQAVGLMSPIAKRNLFVGPAGQWLGGHVPAFLRSYPFRLALAKESEQSILCVDEDSGLVVDANGTDPGLFDVDGNLSAATKTILDFLVAIERDRILTDLAVAGLADASLIQPWPIKVNAEGTAQPLNGLFRVDELALNRLDDEAFLKLRKSSALPLAYMQILSTSQLAMFEQLIRLQHQLAPRPERQFSLDEIFATAESETIRFD
jgi:SapC